jgi:chromosome partitioning protein
VRITVANLKGGVAKTTTTAYLALGLARRGERVLAVDGDPAQPSLLTWAEHAGEAWPAGCVVVAYSGKTLARRVTDLAGGFDHVVIDTGPKSPIELRQALMVTDRLIVPTSPTMLDLLQLPDTFDLASEIDATHPVTAAVLLAKVRGGTRSLADAQAALDDLGVPVLRTRIRHLESFGQAQGTVPDRLAEYADLLSELDGWDAP